MNTYIYELSWYDEDEKKSVPRQGVISGENYGDVISALVDYYGENEIENVRLEWLNDTIVLELTKDALDTFMTGLENK